VKLRNTSSFFGYFLLRSKYLQPRSLQVSWPFTGPSSTCSYKEYLSVRNQVHAI